MALPFPVRKLYLPARHLWLRVRKHAIDATASKITAADPLLIDIGISRRGWEDIGDVSSVNIPDWRSKNDEKQWNSMINAGEDLLHIEWDGHMITSADELYHTVWETITDTTKIEAPLSGKIEQVHSITSEEDEEIDEDTVLVQIATDGETFHESMNDFMEEEDYNEFVKSIPPGKFRST